MKMWRNGQLSGNNGGISGVMANGYVSCNGNVAGNVYQWPQMAYHIGVANNNIKCINNGVIM